MTTIGTLSANLRADTASFEADLARAGRSLRSSNVQMNRSLGQLDGRFNQLSLSVRKMARGFSAVKTAAAGLAAVAGAGFATKRALDFADAIGKTADRIGISTDALQEFRVAGNLAGVSTAQLDKGLEAFSKRLGEARAGTGSLSTILGRLDDRFRQQVVEAASVEDALDLVLRKMGSLEDQQDRTALSAAAFSRTAGVQMANLVRDGADALEEMRRKARDLGLVLDEGLIRNAEIANDKMTLMSEVLSVRLNSALVQVAPAIDNLFSSLIENLPTLIAYLENATERIGSLFGSDFKASPITEIINLETNLGELLEKRAKMQERLARLQTRANETGTRTFDIAISDGLADLADLDSRIGVFEARIAKLRADTGFTQSISGVQTYEAPASGPLQLSIPAPELTGPASPTQEQSMRLLQARLTRIAEEEAATKAFLERLTADYRSATGQRIALINEEREEQLRALEDVNLSVQQAADARKQIETIASAQISEVRMAEFEEARQAYAQQTEAARRLGETLENNIATGLVDVATGYGDLRSVAVNALKTILNYVLQVGRAQQSIFSGGGLFGSLFGGLFGGGFTSGNIGGLSGTPFVSNALGSFTGLAGRAGGGPVSARTPFVIGEQGPEIFVPQSDGVVLPAAVSNAVMRASGAMQAGGGVTVKQNISVHPDVSAIARAEVAKAAPRIAAQAVAAVTDARKRRPNLFAGATP